MSGENPNRPSNEPQNSAARSAVLEETKPKTRSISVSPDQLKRRLWKDRWISKLVSFGGITIIFSILAILFVIVAEVIPLFKKPQITQLGTVGASTLSRPLLVGVDEYREIAYSVDETGTIQFFSVIAEKMRPLNRVDLAGLNAAKISSIASSAPGHFVAGTMDGRAIPFEISFEVKYHESHREIIPQAQFDAPIVFEKDRKRTASKLAYANSDKGRLFIVQLDKDQILLHSVQETKPLIGEPTREESQSWISVPSGNEITEILVDNRAEDLFLGTSKGRILHYALSNIQSPKYGGATEASTHPGMAISKMGFLLGDRRFIVGDAGGGVSAWQLERIPGSQDQRIVRVYEFAAHKQAVTSYSHSLRDKGFVTGDSSGTIQLHYGTTGDTFLSFQSGSGSLSALSFAPKADGLLAINDKGEISNWDLHNPHPEATLHSLFGKVWYEGYEKPEYVWQSTGGTDDFEAKLSLTPLIYGTLKGTFYALLFAIPIALLGALYVSQFMHPSLRGVIKPTVEVMAALPSVVLGFLAGLWIAPNIEKVVVGVFVAPVIIAASILLALMVWKSLPLQFRHRFRHGSEIFLLIPVVFLASLLSFQIGWWIEAGMMGGDYRGWILNTMGLTYDQRNSMVVGFAMGFAVIPIIFTIAEDSLSNVPQHLSAGSLALGATRWQTALRIVLPTGSPGIFSAIMIGFGRAVGETMIVLMATGNTPVMDLSIFSGFRALSANIATELPEAPQSGTLYRVLFLAALLLFILTFIVNTLAELVRLRLRKKYRYL